MPLNICRAVDKAWEEKSLKELLDAPISALEGITPEKAKLLADALGVKTIGELGSNKHFERAQAIVRLASCER